MLAFVPEKANLIVNPDLEATIRLLVRGPGEREIEAVVEGISCFVSLPAASRLVLHPVALLEVIESGEEAR